MTDDGYMERELGLSLELFEEILDDDPILKRIHKSLERENSEPLQNSHSSVVNDCIDRFVESELDVSNPQPYGLGRKDEKYPRIGYFLSESLQDFNFENIFAFKMLLFDLVKSGYDFMVLMESTSGNGLKKPVVTVYEQLFLQWVTSIPDFKFDNLGPAAGIFRDKFAIIRLKKLAEELEPFGLFSRFAQDVLLQHIFRLLIVSGLVLRLAEAYYH